MRRIYTLLTTALSMFVVVACGPAYVDTDGDWDEASSPEVWLPMSTALGRGEVPPVDASIEWTAHTRPDFGVIINVPSTWSVSVAKGEANTGLSIVPGDLSEGVPVYAVVLNVSDRETASNVLSRDPAVIDVLDGHLIDAGKTITGGRELMYAEWSGALTDRKIPCHVLKTAYATHSDGAYTVFITTIIDAHYEEVRPVVLAMLSTLEPLDKNMAAIPVVPAAPATNAAPAQWPSLDTASRGGRRSNDAAVIIAIEDYLMAPDVAGARTNASAWYTYLRDAQGIALDHIRLLRDQEATVEEMEAAVKEARKRAGRRGKVWFVFIGHGAPSADGRDGLLVGVDAQQTPRSLEARSLHRKRLLGELDKAVVVLDACFSGQTKDGALAKGLQPFIPVRGASSHTGITLLTAAGAGQFAGQLPGTTRPAFSYLVLGALRGWADHNHDRRVTAGEVVEYATEALGALVQGRVQTPQLSGKSGTVLATDAAEGGPDLDALILR